MFASIVSSWFSPRFLVHIDGKRDGVTIISVPGGTPVSNSGVVFVTVHPSAAATRGHQVVFVSAAVSTFRIIWRRPETALLRGAGDTHLENRRGRRSGVFVSCTFWGSILHAAFLIRVSGV